MKPQLPSTPSRDVNTLSAGWVRKLLDCVKYGMDTPRGDGRTILRNGAVISAKRTTASGTGVSANANGAVPCKITGVNGYDYNAEIHANGRDLPATGTGVLQIQRIHIAETIETGDWVIAFTSAALAVNQE